MMRTVRLFAAVAPAAALLLAPATVAAPYVPKDDATVLERLPLKPTDPLGRELRELRARLAAQPDDLDAAVTIGRHYFRLAMSEGDPRFIGYAEVALRPWARSEEPPRNVLVLRALLRKYRHDCAGALDDLAAAAASDPSDAEVWLWRAAILLVQADYVGAMSACDPLRARGESLDWIGCKSSVEGVTGGAERAHASLSEGLARGRGVRAGPRLWMLSRLAEFSLVLGETDRAERHFKEALSPGLSGQVLLRSCAGSGRGRWRWRRRTGRCNASRATRASCSKPRSRRMTRKPRNLRSTGSRVPATRTRTCAGWRRGSGTLALEAHRPPVCLRGCAGARAQPERQLPRARGRRAEYRGPVGHRAARPRSRRGTRCQWEWRDQLGRGKGEPRRHRLVCAGAAHIAVGSVCLSSASDRAAGRRTWRRDVCGAALRRDLPGLGHEARRRLHAAL